MQHQLCFSSCVLLVCICSGNHGAERDLADAIISAGCAAPAASHVMQPNTELAGHGAVTFIPVHLMLSCISSLQLRLLMQHCPMPCCCLVTGTTLDNAAEFTVSMSICRLALHRMTLRLCSVLAKAVPSLLTMARFPRSLLR